MTTPTSRIYISQRLRLHYVDWGNETAPPLILLHGGRDHCRNWDWVAQRLCDRFHIIAPDLRGHGDSAWSATGAYPMDGFIYDLAHLIHQQALAPVSILAHSLGGNIALRTTGIFPETVRCIIAIEGLGPSPAMEAEASRTPLDQRLRDWVTAQRDLAARVPRKYPTIDHAFARMRDENRHLSEAQAWHLTRHGVRQNEDGTYSWKFDNYIRAWPPTDISRDDIRALWGRITCPTLLVYGSESWASNPATDGRAAHFPNATVAVVEGAGHWVHHDRLDAFLDSAETFLRQHVLF
jgi:pimeloyl-ACP methyl ester carboxylesterase